MYTIGLDVHTSRSSICILDPSGNPLRRQEIKGRWDPLIAVLAAAPKPFQICYEASTGYGALYERLTPIAARVVVANPSDLALIYQSRQKNDRRDALQLAKLLWRNEVPAVHVPSQSVRSWRSLIECRGKFVHLRVVLKNKIRALLRTFHFAAPRTLWTAAGKAWLLAQAWPTPLETLQIQQLLLQIDHLNKSLLAFENQLDKFVSEQPELCAKIALLRSVPGVGPRTSEAFLAYVDDPSRFNSQTIGPYLGLVPSEDSSGGTVRFGRITKEGPGTVRKLLAEAAWRAISDSPAIKARYQRHCKNDRQRRKRAIVAVSHFLARLSLAVLKSGKPYCEPAAATPAAWPKPQGDRA